jgi:hypothetical protein
MHILLLIVAIVCGAIIYLSIGYLLAQWSIEVHRRQDNDSFASFLLFPFSHFYRRLRAHDAFKLNDECGSDEPASRQGWYKLYMCLFWWTKLLFNLTAMLVLAGPKIVRHIRTRPKKPKPPKTKRPRTNEELYRMLRKALESREPVADSLAEARQLIELRHQLDERLKFLAASLEQRLAQMNNKLSEVQKLAQPAVLDMDEKLYGLLAEQYANTDEEPSHDSGQATSSAKTAKSAS